MKKSLFFMVSLVAMLFTMTTLTSCEKGAEYSIVMECVSYINNSKNISSETAAGISACEERIDARLVEMFGKTFNAKTDENAKEMDPSDFDKFTKRIKKDSKIQDEIKKLHEFKTLDSEQAVYSVLFLFKSVNTVFGEYEVSLQ